MSSLDTSSERSAMLYYVYIQTYIHTIIYITVSPHQDKDVYRRAHMLSFTKRQVQNKIWHLATTTITDQITNRKSKIKTMFHKTFPVNSIDYQINPESAGSYITNFKHKYCTCSGISVSVSRYPRYRYELATDRYHQYLSFEEAAEMQQRCQCVVNGEHQEE